LVAGCGEKQNNDTNGGTIEADKNNEPSNNTQNETPQDNKEPVAISYLLPTDPGCDYTSETWAVQAWGKATGVKFDIQPVPRDTFTEKIAAVMASGKLPDMINFYQDAKTFKDYGPQLFVALDDYIEDGKLPNLKNKLEVYPDIAEVLVHPEDGKIYGFPLVQNFEFFTNCWQIRSDLLEKAGWKAEDIKTLEDFKEAMLALKESQGKDYITSSRLGFSYFSGMTGSYFGTNPGVFLDNRNPNGSNKYIYGPIQPEYKVWIETMKWMYDNKLLHPNFATMQQQELYAGYVDGSFPLMMEQLGMYHIFETDGDNIAAITPFEINGIRNRIAKTSHINIGFRFPVVISNKSAVIEDAIRAMDFLYSDEGNILMSRGEEGTHWVEDESYPAGFKIIGYQAPYLKEELGEEKFNELPRSIEDLGINSWWLMGNVPAWNRHALQQFGPEQKDVAMFNYNLVELYEKNGWLIDPDPVLNFSNEEQERIAEIGTPLNTYVEENSMKFITGQKSMDEWDDFINGLEELNYQEIVDLQNSKLQ
jgi:putative aldouronate transport system substrate-binding protein